MADTSSKRHIVIVGGGIIGCTTALYLTRHKAFSPETTSVTILEASSVAGGASGKAGGLVAKWAYPRELVDITFKEHEKLAQEYDGMNRWGWRYTNVGQWEGRGELIDTGSSKMPSAISLNKKDDWVKETLTDSYDPMARERETAQVHPYQFTTSMCALAQENGAQLIMGKAVGITYAEIPEGGKHERAVAAVAYIDADSGESRTIPASHVIVSAGPWTPTILPQVPISSMRAHSITVRPTRPVSAYVLFTEITMPEPYSAASPEIYARPNNEVYACSPGDALPLPASTAEVQVDDEVCDVLFKQVSSISAELRGGELTARQACYLANVDAGPRGCPIVGEDEKVKGLIIAAGHTCWGICNAPGTAKVVSELILDGKITCGKFSKLEPRLFI